MDLKSIGFYTLSDERVKQASINSPLWRCELILTARCNFKCPYCRHVGGKDLDYDQAADTVVLWAKQNLKNIRFSGGEPTLYPRLIELVELSKSLGIERIAVSTNGSAGIELYRALIKAGANDLSISLDACCASDGDKMAGSIAGSWDKVVQNIKILAKETYVTVGIVLNEQNVNQANDIIKFAHDLGVDDIRVIPAAQEGSWLNSVSIDEEMLATHPILRYRVNNMVAGLPVRGLCEYDSNRCGLVMDDMAVMGDKHYPCIIYMREQGKEIGKIGPAMRGERAIWSATHNTHKDPICSNNCLDVCRDYNNKFLYGVEI